MFNKVSELIRLSRFDEALHAVESDILEYPDYSWITLFNKAIILIHLGRLNESKVVLKNLKNLSISDPQHLHALGDAFYCMGCYRDAISVYKRNIHTNPKYYSSYFCLGITQLLLGDYTEGFKNYEFRSFIPSELTASMKPKWLGDASVGKTVLILAEQGYGDTIQFIRYLDYLKAPRYRGVKFILALPVGFLDICKGLGFELVNRTDPFPEHDYFVDMISLAAMFQENLRNIPPPTRFDFIILRPVHKRIGFAWRGNPKHRRDLERSIKLDEFIPLFQIRNLEFVCLQKDVTHQEKALLDRYDVLQPSLVDWRHTIAELEQCERLISPDTAIGHLGGVMGVSTWILIHYSPDWRWMLQREDSPWYPSVKLFRQQIIHSWKEPICKMVDFLTE